MAGVPQKTLNWLYDVLKREYRDANRTYADIAQTLTQYPGLAPRTDVYTSENGVPALLLNLKGTLPVNFRGTVYRFPIALWVPHAYPYESPIVYVTPTDDMVVRPGQHVSASDGKIYHHYLARWRDAWDRSTVVEFLNILAEVFSREPPVTAKTQQMPPAQQPQQHRQGGPPSVPPLSQDQRRYGSQPPLPGSPSYAGSSSQGGPPPPPPKQVANTSRQGSAGPLSPAPKPGRYDAPPPLPPQPQSGRPPSLPPQPYGNGSTQQPPAGMQNMPQRTSSLRQEYREQPPPPPPTQQYQPQSPGRPLPNRGPDQPPTIYRDGPPIQAQQTGPPPMMHPVAQSPPHQQAQQPSHPIHPHQRSQAYMQQPQAQSHQQHHQHPRQQQIPPQARNQQPPPQPIQQPKPAPQKDLLSEDDPFQVSLSTTTKPNLPAPPIPVNPEKTVLLSHVSHLILQRLHNNIKQTQTSALPSLQSQHAALQNASQTLTAEMQPLQTLSQQLQSNIAALQATINNANNTIKSTQDKKHPSHPDNIPVIDQIIIPPTVVARQLYDAVAEQRGYEAAIFALNEAFVRGRIGAEVWGRKVRECAREEMRRKWLVRKIGEGLGLEEQ